MYYPIGGVLELSYCLRYRFLLVSIAVPFADVRQDPLLFSCQLHLFQGMHRNGLQLKQDYVLVVRCSISVISSSRQCIWFAYGTSGAVVKQEVEPSQMQGPAGLTTVKFLGCYEILEVLVISLDLYQMGRSFQEVSPLF